MYITWVNASHALRSLPFYLSEVLLRDLNSHWSSFATKEDFLVEQLRK